MPFESADAVVIGGGFYGLRLAAMLAADRQTVLLERGAEFSRRASYNNQARVHGGYHYPRSVLTALRAREHYARFHREFADALGAPFEHVYAIARHQSKVRAREFEEFCRRIGAPLVAAPRSLSGLFDDALVERAFVAEEAVFDANRLGALALASANAAGACCLPDVEVVALEPGRARRLRVRWRMGSESGETEADVVVSATYSALNDVLEASGLDRIPLVHEVAEIAIVEPPAVLRGRGVTVMDGPFWSCIPFPALHAHSLTHVRYTPHTRRSSDRPEAALMADRDTSHAILMQRDAQRYLPAMKDARHLSSLWETKTVLPRSEGDDSRPILVRAHHDAPGLVSVLGAKIDSVYDVEDELRELLASVQHA